MLHYIALVKYSVVNNLLKKIKNPTQKAESQMANQIRGSTASILWVLTLYETVVLYDRRILICSFGNTSLKNESIVKLQAKLMNPESCNSL